jgi:hypothetical protein
MEGYFESYSYGKSIITRFIYLQNILYKQCNVLTIMKGNSTNQIVGLLPLFNGQEFESL